MSTSTSAASPKRRTYMSPETFELRRQVLQKYGGRCVCACGCRSRNLRRLQFDHINGGGSKERLEGWRGAALYTKLWKEPVDPALQLLCAGCHFEKTMYGGCTRQPIRSLPTQGLNVTLSECGERGQEPQVIEASPIPLAEAPLVHALPVILPPLPDAEVRSRWGLFRFRSRPSPV
jgi:hypothetical protein